MCFSLARVLVHQLASIKNLSVDPDEWSVHWRLGRWRVRVSRLDVLIQLTIFYDRTRGVRRSEREREREGENEGVPLARCCLETHTCPSSSSSLFLSRFSTFRHCMHAPRAKESCSYTPMLRLLLLLLVLPFARINPGPFHKLRRSSIKVKIMYEICLLIILSAGGALASARSSRPWGARSTISFLLTWIYRWWLLPCTTPFSFHPTRIPSRLSWLGNRRSREQTCAAGQQQQQKHQRGAATAARYVRPRLLASAHVASSPSLLYTSDTPDHLLVHSGCLPDFTSYVCFLTISVSPMTSYTIVLRWNREIVFFYYLRRRLKYRDD